MDAVSSAISTHPFSYLRRSVFVGKQVTHCSSSVSKSHISDKNFMMVYHPMSVDQRVKLRRMCSVFRASSSIDPSSPSPIAPLQLVSPVGQFLSRIQVSHPHLMPAAIEQQLEQFKCERDAEEEPLSSGTDLILYRRIAEVKAKERTLALEEILYALVVQRFKDADISLAPSLTNSTDCSSSMGVSPYHIGKFQQLHSVEVYEMIRNHLALILGNRINDTKSIAKISRTKLGQVYAASIMYGYFLKQVDLRFQLEKTVRALNDLSSHGGVDEIPEDVTGNIVKQHEEQSHPKVKESRLRTYVMSFDADMLQKYATMRSQEAVSIVERHTTALFGKPDFGTALDSVADDLVRIDLGGLRRMALEAVTFGSFLWDAECFADSRYHFVAS